MPPSRTSATRSTLRGHASAACIATIVATSSMVGGCAGGSGTRLADPTPADPASAGWKAEALQQVVDYVRGQKTTGFLIIHQRRILVETNWPLPRDPATANFQAAFVHGQAPSGALLEDVASQQKSFVAILAGIAVDRHLLDIDNAVSTYVGIGWSRTAPETEAKVRVRHLLEMNSGLKEDLTSEAEPGARFFYNTPAYAMLKRVLEAASKRTLDDLTRDWLTAPLGMGDTSWRLRPAALGDVGNPIGLVTTPRDIAKVGQMILDAGRAIDGRQVISSAQLRALFRRTSTNPAYGHLWWLNGSGHVLAIGSGAPRREGALVPDAPADMVMALGALDRKLFVVPARDLIVVRTGQATPDKEFNRSLWTRVMRAAP